MATTQRELELELELWQERAAGVQVHANLLNAQAQLLGVRSKECSDNIARLKDALAAHTTGGGVTGTGAQTEGGGVVGTGAQIEGGGATGTGGTAQ